MSLRVFIGHIKWLFSSALFILPHFCLQIRKKTRAVIVWHSPRLYIQIIPHHEADSLIFIRKYSDFLSIKVFIPLFLLR